VSGSWLCLLGVPADRRSFPGAGRTPCLRQGTTQRGYRLFHCTEDAITTEFVPVRDVQPRDVQQ